VTLIVVILLVALFFWRRNHLKNTPSNRPINLTGDDGDGPSEDHMQETHPPSFYQAEPFLLPDRTSTGRTSFQGGQPGLEAGAQSAYSDDDRDAPNSRPSSSEVPPGSITSSSRKSGGFPRPMRPVNIIQHDDAGPSEPGIKEDEEPETIELPPAYTNLKR